MENVRNFSGLRQMENTGAFLKRTAVVSLRSIDGKQPWLASNGEG